MRTSPRSASLLTVLALLAAGCGDDGGSDPSGSAMAEAFGAATAEAYEAEGLERDEDFNRGVRLEEGCLLVDDDLAEDLLEAAFEGAPAGDDDAEAEAAGGFVQGIPDESEAASCSLRKGDLRMAAILGTTLRDVEQQEAAARRGAMSEAERVDVDVDGLPSDEVLVLADEEGEIVSATWIGDGFFVALNAPLRGAEPEQVARALGIAVDRVADELDG